MARKDYGDSDADMDLARIVNVTCDFLDLENFVCRYVASGLVVRDYKDSLCSACLSGLEMLRGAQAD